MDRAEFMTWVGLVFSDFTETEFEEMMSELINTAVRAQHTAHSLSTIMASDGGSLQTDATKQLLLSIPTQYSRTTTTGEV